MLLYIKFTLFTLAANKQKPSLFFGVLFLAICVSFSIYFLSFLTQLLSRMRVHVLICLICFLETIALHVFHEIFVFLIRHHSRTIAL